MMLGRSVDPQSTHRVIPRQDGNLDALCILGVEGQQLLDERERNAREGWLIDPVKLEIHIGAVVALVENSVLLFKIAKGPGGYGDHEFAIEGCSHGIIPLNMGWAADEKTFTCYAILALASHWPQFLEIPRLRRFAGSVLGDAGSHRISVDFKHLLQRILIASCQIPDYRNTDLLPHRKDDPIPLG